MTATFALKTAKIIYTIKAISSRWNFVYAALYIHLVDFFFVKIDIEILWKILSQLNNSAVAPIANRKLNPVKLTLLSRSRSFSSQQVWTVE